jgi:hypothetical protein
MNTFPYRAMPPPRNTPAADLASRPLIPLGQVHLAIPYLCYFFLEKRLASFVAKPFLEPLRRLERLLEAGFGARYQLPARLVAEWFAPLRWRLERRAGATAGRRNQRRPSRAKPGDTTLADYFPGESEAGLKRRLEAGEAGGVPIPIKMSYWQYYELVHAQNRAPLYNFIFYHARQNEDLAKELAQETWKEFWVRLPIYNPARSSPLTFLKRLAGHVLARHFAERRDYYSLWLLLASHAQCSNRAGEETVPAEEVERLRALAESQVRQRLPLREMYDELFALLVEGRLAPHKMLAFIGCKLLEWSPKEIVTELSTLTLRQIATHFEHKFADFSPLLATRAQAAFVALQAQMSSPGKAKGDVPGRPFGDIRLEEYLTGGSLKQKADNVVKWWDAVKKRLVARMLRQRRGALHELLEEVNSRRRGRDARKKGKPK